MDALQDDDLAGLQGNRRGQVILLPEGEVIIRQEHFLAGQKAAQ